VHTHGNPQESLVPNLEHSVKGKTQSGSCKLSFLFETGNDPVKMILFFILVGRISGRI
jgi:hypothetical protein